MKKKYKYLPILFFLIILFTYLALYSFNKYFEGKINNNYSYSVSTQEDRDAIVDKINNYINTPEDIKFNNNSKDINQPKESLSYKLWEGEIDIRNTNMHYQYGPGPDLGELIKIKYVSDPIDILILGDSYSSGQFGELYSDSYAKRLERLLNSEQPGLYRVRTLASEKGSFLRQSDWLTIDRLRVIKPDLVILTYTMGRFMPTFYEKKYCKEYNTCIKDNSSSLYNDALSHDFAKSSPKWRIIMCLRADKSFISTILRKFIYPNFPHLGEWVAKNYCSDERAKKGIDLPTERDVYYYESPEKTPYFQDFIDYLDRVSTVIELYNGERRELGLDPVIKSFLTLTWLPGEFSSNLVSNDIIFTSKAKVFTDQYKKYGFEEIDTNNAKLSVGLLKTWEIGNLSGSGQGGKSCNYDCIRDENTIIENLKWYRAGAINHPLKYRLGSRLSNSFAEDINSYVLSKLQGIVVNPIVDENMIIDYSPFYLSVTNKSNYTLLSITDEVLELKSRKEEFFSYNQIQPPCAEINHPHAVLAINHNFFQKDDNIDFSYYKGEINNLYIGIKSENKDGISSFKYNKLLKVGERLSIKYDPSISKIYIADYNKKCIENSVNELGSFLVKISKN